MCWENATWKNYFEIFLVAGASGKPIAHPTFLPLAPIFKTAGARCITLLWTHIPFRGYLCCLFVIFKKVLYPTKSNSSICGLPVTCTTITFIHLYHYYSLHICFVVVVVFFLKNIYHLQICINKLVCNCHQFFLVPTSTSYNSLTVIFVVTCTFEVSETRLPDKSKFESTKKRPQIFGLIVKAACKFRKLWACSTPTTQKVWLKKWVHCQGSWGSKLWACGVT